MPLQGFTAGIWPFNGNNAVETRNFCTLWQCMPELQQHAATEFYGKDLAIFYGNNAVKPTDFCTLRQCIPGLQHHAATRFYGKDLAIFFTVTML